MTPVQAFALAFCGLPPESAWLIRPGDEIDTKWTPAVTWGLGYARARQGKTATLVRDTAQAMSERPLVDGERYPDGHLHKFMAGVTAMIAAAQQQARAKPAARDERRAA